MVHPIIESFYAEPVTHSPVEQTKRASGAWAFLYDSYSQLTPSSTGGLFPAIMSHLFQQAVRQVEDGTQRQMHEDRENHTRAAEQQKKLAESRRPVQRRSTRLTQEPPRLKQEWTTPTAQQGPHASFNPEGHDLRSWHLSILLLTTPA